MIEIEKRSPVNLQPIPCVIKEDRLDAHTQAAEEFDGVSVHLAAVQVDITGKPLPAGRVKIFVTRSPDVKDLFPFWEKVRQQKTE